MNLNNELFLLKNLLVNQHPSKILVNLNNIIHPLQPFMGKYFFSNIVGFIGILSIIFVDKIYNPALILSDIKCFGFSTN